MKTIRLFQIDAFADAVFRGNPAAVCPLESPLEDSEMQSIAAENNLAETAFFLQRGDEYDLRWFTPKFEVDLCGHATLASAFVILELLLHPRDIVRFHTRSGVLEVSRDGDLFVLNFPSAPPMGREESPRALLAGLRTPPIEVLWAAGDVFAVYETEEAVQSIVPRLDKFEELDTRGVVVTAPGNDVDFVSRYFAPRYGIPEDPVTGSTHCTLIPYWAERLGKTRLHARQVSKRGGDLYCEALGDRVSIAGRAVQYMEGSISL